MGDGQRAKPGLDGQHGLTGLYGQDGLEGRSFLPKGETESSPG